MKEAAQLEIFSTTGINLEEAPEGYYPILKNDAATSNICRSCDARILCQQNQNEWCKKNPCMSYSRNDGMPVIFKMKL
jgi:hypothetical protein